METRVRIYIGLLQSLIWQVLDSIDLRAVLVIYRESTASQKFYAVRMGVWPRIYIDWLSCKAHMNGIRKARYKSFWAREEGERFL